MGIFKRLFGKKKKDESYYLKSYEEIKIENELNKKESEKNSQAASYQDTESYEIDVEESEKIATSGTEEKVKIKGLVGFFDIKRSKDGRFVFNLYAANRVIIATSQIYSSSQSAQIGIKSVIANAEKAVIEDQTLKNFASLSYPKWEIYKDKAGQYRFRLCASNGSCVCHSHGYTTKASCKNGIESIIRTVKNANIDKSYLKK